MNSRLDDLQPYPFQRLRTLFADLEPPGHLAPIDLSIGEPRHPAPEVLKSALTAALSGLSGYPATAGSIELREAAAAWLQRRYGVDIPAADSILPVNGSREALFAFVQSVIDPHDPVRPVVISPNPFYQIYEGAALLAGAEPYFVNCRSDTRFLPDWSEVPDAVWHRTRLVFVCSPGNPTGTVMSQSDWQTLFALQDRYGFVIASDECYAEIHFGTPPLGVLDAARQAGRSHDGCIMFTSLSKRSNAPGLRSGFVAGDPALIKPFLLYRTYHGSAMSQTVQQASIAAWNDEAHVAENRRAYCAKFDAVVPILASCLDTAKPDASFYLWAGVPGGDDTEFARALYRHTGVTTLPGSFLARDAHGVNPGRGYIRIALVAPLESCIEAAARIAAFTTDYRNQARQRAGNRNETP